MPLTVFFLFLEVSPSVVLSASTGVTAAAILQGFLQLILTVSHEKRAAPMKIIYNKHFPFGSFSAINLFGYVFCRVDKGRLPETAKNHEYIHSLQQKELLYIGFYLLYIAEWLYHLARLRNFMKAYYALSFEREAYTMQGDMNYKYKRKKFANFRLGLKAKG